MAVYFSEIIMTTNHTAKTSALKGYTLLLLTSLLWGTAFIFQKNATDHVDAFTFNFLRFGVAIPALFVLFLLPKQLFNPEDGDISEHKRLRHSAAFIGIGAGFFMFLGISLQQWGLSYTTAGKSGFLTALYIIIVPILGLFVRQRCRVEVWAGAMLTLLGVYLLGSHDSGNVETDFNRGDVMTVISAFAWAAQVLWLGIFARYANVLQIAIIQMATITILSGIAMFAINGALPAIEVIWQMRYDILYTGAVSSAIAFTLQILGQRHVPATNAALLMSTEAIFAMLGGIIVLGEAIALSGFFGCSLIMAGIMLAQLQGKVFK